MKDDYVYPRPTNQPMAPGIELRDWFAGMALQGFLGGRNDFADYDQAAIDAYAYADAMIEHGQKQG